MCCAHYFLAAQILILHQVTQDIVVVGAAHPHLMLCAAALRNYTQRLHSVIGVVSRAQSSFE